MSYYILNSYCRDLEQVSPEGIRSCSLLKKASPRLARDFLSQVQQAPYSSSSFRFLLFPARKNRRIECSIRCVIRMTW